MVALTFLLFEDGRFTYGPRAFSVSSGRFEIQDPFSTCLNVG